MNALLSLKDRISSRLRRLPIVACGGSPLGQVEATRTSTLERLPTEILLHIVSFLPESSIACMSLTSKWHHETLVGEFDPKMRDNFTEKQRFLRLLEEDLPEMMACCSCNILYRWQNGQRYLCPKRRFHVLLSRGALWCFAHKPTLIYRNMVDAFLRGFAKGSRYGPQLHELKHNCKSNGDELYQDGDIDTSLNARIVRGKLLLHGVHKLSVSLSAQPPGTLTSQVDTSKIVPDGLVPAINKFRTIGCVHAQNTLPAVILDAFQLRVGGAGDRTRSLDLLNCGYCATDLRVRVELECGGTCVQIEVEIWQSFGGREPDNRDETEDAHFRYECGWGHGLFDINSHPDRNLEKMFKEGVEGECGMVWSSDQVQRRQSWIQLWQWHYDPHTTRLCRYCVPCNEAGMSALIQEQASPVQCAIQ